MLALVPESLFLLYSRGEHGVSFASGKDKVDAVDAKLSNELVVLGNHVFGATEQQSQLALRGVVLEKE